MPADNQLQFGLKAEVIDRIARVFAAVPGVRRVILYGSRAKGNFHTGSDIDLVIEGDVSPSQLLKIESDLDDLLLPYTIDLAQRDSISNPDLLEHISRVGVVFYEKAK